MKQVNLRYSPQCIYFIPPKLIYTYTYIYICNHENNVPSWLSAQWLCGSSWKQCALPVITTMALWQLHTYIYMIFNVVLKFLDLRYKVSLTRESNPQPSDFHSNALLTELASLTQRWSSTVNVYMRSDIEGHELVPGC